MKKIDVSVIIPTNRIQYLDEAINSALKQKNVVLEVLIVDDGAVPTIKSQLIDKPPEVRVVRHRKNLGLPSARNTGVKNARGNYIVFLDCDDKLDNNFAKEMINACQKSQAKISVCFPRFFFEQNFPLLKKLIFLLLNSVRDFCLLCCYLFNHKSLTKDSFFLVQSSHVIFKKEILERHLSDSSYLTAANDWKLMAEILFCERVAILPKKLSYYRYHHQSQTRTENKISKWNYYDRMLKEIPNPCKKGLFVSLFRCYNFIGRGIPIL